MAKSISWKNLEVGYASKKSLTYPSSASISQPGIYAISGPNGAGKSTFLKTILGLIKPIKGNISFCHTEASQHSTLGCHIAYVPQFHTVNQFFHIKVLDFVCQGFGPNFTPNKAQLKLVQTLLSEWQLHTLQSNSFHDLSGGQKARCLIVRALIAEPQYLFLDEPMSHLDSCCQQQLFQTLQNSVAEKGCLVFMIDHHLENYSKFVKQKIIFHKHHDDIKYHIAITNC